MSMHFSHMEPCFRQHADVFLETWPYTLLCGGLEELGRRRCRCVAGSAPEYFRAGENAGGMIEGQCDCANLPREGRHPGLWNARTQ